MDVQKGEKYATWRHRMDEGTRDSCSNHAALQSRFKGGAKAGKAASNDQRPQTPDNSGPPQTLHCHWSCSAFTHSPCAQPKDCEEKCEVWTDCPIKEAFGDHDCGFSTEFTEDQLVIANVTRVENNKQPLQKLRWLGDNRHMLVAAPHNRVMELQDSPVRMMTVTVNENYEGSNRDDDDLYEQEDSDDEIEMTRHLIQTDSESDSTEPTSGSPNQQPQAASRSGGYMQTIIPTIQSGTGPATTQLQFRPEIRMQVNQLQFRHINQRYQAPARRPIQTDSESDSTEPTSGSPNQRPRTWIGESAKRTTRPSSRQLKASPQAPSDSESESTKRTTRPSSRQLVASPQTLQPNLIKTVAATNNSKCAGESEIRMQVNQQPQAPPTDAPKAVAATNSSKCACESEIRMQVNQQPPNSRKCAMQSNQQPSTPSAPADQDSSKRETSYLGDFYRWSRESKTTKTKGQFKVSYH